ncbi:MAG: YkgJ family cysteine cluster protein [Acidobacteria bacterium]|nr:YkgJ family cysteine cluster protein [Acidobacteriota bacterium]
MEEAAQKSGDWLVCRPGCNQCCLGPFDITPLDAHRLRQGLAQLATPTAAAIHARVEAYIPHEDAPCPALNPHSGLCDLYEFRPITCRVFGPVTHTEDGLAACELCYTTASEQQMAACAVHIDPDGLEAAILSQLDDDAPTTVAEALKPLCS